MLSHCRGQLEVPQSPPRAMLDTCAQHALPLQPPVETHHMWWRRVIAAMALLADAPGTCTASVNSAHERSAEHAAGCRCTLPGLGHRALCRCLAVKEQQPRVSG